MIETLADMERYVAELPDAEICRWTSADWCAFYKKLNALIEKQPTIKIENRSLKEKSVFRLGIFKELFGERAFTKWQRKDVQNNSNRLKKELYAQGDGAKMFCKLNRNYRMEKSVFEEMVRISKTIGFQLARENTDAAALHVMNLQNKENYLEIGKAVDRTIWKTTDYAQLTGKLRKSYGKLKSEILIRQGKADFRKRILGARENRNCYSSNVILNMYYNQDSLFGTAIHEGIHAHYQMWTAWQRYLKDNGVMPKAQLSAEFCELLLNSSDYYIGCEAGLTKDEIKSYRRQPIEKMAYMMSKMTEHYFRMKTKQYSERTAQYISVLVYDSIPMKAYYQDGNITLTYYRNCLGKGGESKADFKEKYMRNLDSQVFDRFKFKIQKNTFFLQIPLDYKIRAALEKQCRANYMNANAYYLKACMARCKTKF